MGKNECKTNHIILVEGMEMTGKDTFIDKTFPKYYNRFSIDSKELIDTTIGRENAWATDYGVIITLESLFNNQDVTNLMNLNVVLNGGFVSALVYDHLYGRNLIKDSKIIDWYKNSAFFKDDIYHIYIKHHDINTAEIIYNKAMEDREQQGFVYNKKYDRQFTSFRDYWVTYTNADMLFAETYDKLGIKPMVYDTLSDFNWSEED